MKKIIYSAASLLMFAACSEVSFNEDQMGGTAPAQPLSINAISEVDSRVAVDDEWAVTWEDNDALLGYSKDAAEFTKFSMDENNSTSATFVGGSDANSYRVVYPYVELTEAVYNVNLSVQHSGIKSTYLIGEEEVSATNSSVNMKHIGATMALTIKGLDALAGYRLKAVELQGVPTTATIDLTQEELAIDETSGTYGTTNAGAAICVVIDEDITIAAGSEPVIKFNILPFSVDAAKTMTAALNVVNADGVDYTVTATVTNSGELINFERAKYHKMGVTCDVATKVEGVKLSMVNTENCPDGTAWTIIDAGGDIGADNYIGAAKYEGLKKAIMAHSGAVELTLSNIERIAGNALIDCTNLISVNAPKATYIDYGVFKNCDDLTSVSLPSAVEFGDNIVLSSGVTNLEIATAEGAKLTTITSKSFYGSGDINLVIGRQNEALISKKTLALGDFSFTFNSIVDENGDEFVSEGPALPIGSAYLSDFKEDGSYVPDGTTWTIYAEGDTSNFANLKATLNAIESSAEISLIFPEASFTSLPANAFEKATIKSVTAPYVTTVNAKVFNGASVESVEIASATGVKMKKIQSGVHSFGYAATVNAMALILGTANAEYVTEKTLKVGNVTVDYDFESITLRDYEGSTLQ